MRRAILGTLVIALLGLGLLVIRPLEAQTPSSGGAFLPNTVIRIAGIWLNDKLLWSRVAPTISSGFGTSPSVASHNGNATFRVNVGTGGSASTGVIGLTTSPPAATGWNCQFTTVGSPAGKAFITKQTASTTTSVSIAGYLDDGTTGAWASGAVLIATCAAY